MPTVANAFRSWIHTLRWARIIAKRRNVLPDSKSVFRCWRFLKNAAANRRPGPCQAPLGSLTLHGDNFTDLFELFEEVFLGEAYRVELPGRAPVIFDCGANIGLATIFFKLHFPNAAITAFEPHPRCFALLKQNVEVNRLANITLVEAACGTASGETSLYVTGNKTQGSSTKKVWQEEMTPQKVRRVRLSDHINGTVNLLKMDVEGAEWEVLEDLVATGKLSLVERIIIEFHHRLGDVDASLGRFLKLLDDRGFTYTIETLTIEVKRFSPGWHSVMIYAVQKALAMRA